MTLRGECNLLMTVAFIKWHYICTCAEELKPTIASIDSPAGLYFDEMRQVLLYPTQWKIVGYVNLKTYPMLWEKVKTHQSLIISYCSKIHNATCYPLTDCRAFTPYIRTKVQYIG